MAPWGFPAGVIGGRLYFDLISSELVPPHWWRPFAIWDGGMGIQELFGSSSNLTWALQISPAHRPAGYESFATFHPTFLYELI